MTRKAPQIGALVTVRGVACHVAKVHPFGTMDVVSTCGRFAWRVSGLDWVKP